jgi:DNA-binding transcriptional MerR regulator
MTELMTIRDMCEAYGVTPRALRFYEQKELLGPLRSGTRRLYTQRDRARLRLMLRGKRFGFSLEELRQLLDLYDGPGGSRAQLAKGCALARGRLAALERQRADLDQAIAELRGHIALAQDQLQDA